MNSLYFFDSANTLKWEIVAFRDFAHLIILFIGLAVLGIMASFLFRTLSGRSLTEHSVLETS